MAGLLSVGLIAALLASEIAFRALSPFLCQPRVGPFQPHPVYGWGHTPGAERQVTGCFGRRFAYDRFVKINSLGLHDQETPYERLEGRKRVLLLGDSVAEGMQVEIAETFAKVAQERLNSEGPAVEIVNTGVSAFGTDNQVLFFREEGRKYGADLVVATFNIQNDVSENYPPFAKELYAAGNGSPKMKAKVTVLDDGLVKFDTTGVAAEALKIQAKAEANAQAAQTLSAKLTANFYLLRRMQKLFVDSPAPKQWTNKMIGRVMLGVYAEPRDKEWTEAWQITEALLAQLAHDVRSQGAELLVLILPPRVLVERQGNGSTNFDYPRERAAAILNDLGVPFLDATDALREHLKATGKSGFFEFDIHPDPNGHRVIGQALAPAIHERLEAQN